MATFLEFFNINEQYVFAANKMGLNIHRMSPEQHKQTRRFFVAAVGQVLLQIRDEGAQMSEEDLHEKLDDLLEQCMDFWKSQR